MRLGDPARPYAVGFVSRKYSMPWKLRRYSLSGSFSRMPYLSLRLMTNRFKRPTLAASLGIRSDGRASGH